MYGLSKVGVTTFVGLAFALAGGQTTGSGSGNEEQLVPGRSLYPSNVSGKSVGPPVVTGSKKKFKSKKSRVTAPIASSKHAVKGKEVKWQPVVKAPKKPFYTLAPAKGSTKKGYVGGKAAAPPVSKGCSNRGCFLRMLQGKVVSNAYSKGSSYVQPRRKAKPFKGSKVAAPKQGVGKGKQVVWQAVSKPLKKPIKAPVVVRTKGKGQVGTPVVRQPKVKKVKAKQYGPVTKNSGKKSYRNLEQKGATYSKATGYNKATHMPVKTKKYKMKKAPARIPTKEKFPVTTKIVSTPAIVAPVKRSKVALQSKVSSAKPWKKEVPYASAAPLDKVYSPAVSKALDPFVSRMSPKVKAKKIKQSPAPKKSVGPSPTSKYSPSVSKVVDPIATRLSASKKIKTKKVKNTTPSFDSGKYSPSTSSKYSPSVSKVMEPFVKNFSPKIKTKKIKGSTSTTKFDTSKYSPSVSKVMQPFVKPAATFSPKIKAKKVKGSSLKEYSSPAVAKALEPIRSKLRQ